MAGKIFMLAPNDKISSIEPTPYDNEDHLQTLIEANPEILGGDQMNLDDTEVKFLLVEREASIADSEESGDRWSSDLLFVDQYATLTIVETKLSKNSELRRKVVAQVLEYAANIANSWNVDEIKEKLKTENIVNTLGIPEEKVDAFWNELESNIQTGKYRLLFVADKIPSELLKIIEFLNDQMSKCSIYAIEILFFKGESGHRILVPNVKGMLQTQKEKKSNSGKNITEDELKRRLKDSGVSEQNCDRLFKWVDDLVKDKHFGKYLFSSDSMTIRIAPPSRIPEAKSKNDMSCIKIRVDGKFGRAAELDKTSTTSKKAWGLPTTSVDNFVNNMHKIYPEFDNTKKTETTGVWAGSYVQINDALIEKLPEIKDAIMQLVKDLYEEAEKISPDDAPENG